MLAIGKEVIDMIGKKFNRLTVLERVADDNYCGYACYLCQCDCGNTKVVPGNYLRNGKVKSCGCLVTHRASNVVHPGDRFGKLVVVKQVFGGDYKYKSTRFLCRCDCGNEKIVTGSALTSGSTKSCGCYQKSDECKAKHREAIAPYLEKFHVERETELEGKQFGNLTAVKFLGNNGTKNCNVYWLCECDCGASVTVHRARLIDGSITGCKKCCPSPPKLRGRRPKHCTLPVGSKNDCDGKCDSCGWNQNVIEERKKKIRERLLAQG